MLRWRTSAPWLPRPCRTKAIGNSWAEGHLLHSFGTTTRELEALRTWLAEHGVTHVGMESTGVY